MNKFLNYTAVCLLLLISFSCEDENGIGESVNYITFESGPLATDLVENATSTFDVTVYTGNIVGADRTLAIMVSDDTALDASTFSVPATVTVPGNSNEGSFAITFTDNDNLGFVAEQLILTFEEGNGISVGDPLVIDVAQECLDTLVTLDLTFDNWAEEASWEIYDLSGTTPAIIFSGGSGGEYTDLDNSSISLNFCLASGNYGIAVYDAYGDGGTDYVVSAGGAELSSGSVPGGNPANVGTVISDTFTID
ncbi:hypothetical protein [Winogradskyella sp. R77965]|uniref:hypothetical protein n=1 Tax=Winogradskyella sp. R77965 TaxID=3093872 RepID=UPI0037DC06DC